jgi:hypothetical protein
MAGKNKDEHEHPHHHGHPVAVGAGAVAAGAVGAALGGAVGGPIGAAVGAAVGALAGGLGGEAAGEAENPTLEDAYWADEHRNRDYVAEGESYEQWRPAFRYGWEARMMHGGSTWEQIEPQLGAGWLQARGDSTLDWDRAKSAARDAFERMPGPKSGPGNALDRAFEMLDDSKHPTPSAAHTGEPLSRGQKDPLDR